MNEGREEEKKQEEAQKSSRSCLSGETGNEHKHRLVCNLPSGEGLKNQLAKPPSLALLKPPPAVLSVLTVRIRQSQVRGLENGQWRMHTSKPKRWRCCLKNGAFQVVSSGGLDVGLLGVPACSRASKDRRKQRRNARVIIQQKAILPKFKTRRHRSKFVIR